MSADVTLEQYPERLAASRAAAELISNALGESLRRMDRAGLVVSGGTTPGDCFGFLSEKSLDWSRVDIVPSDERWVPADHPDSNQGMIQSELMQHEAASAQFVPFHREGLEASQAPEAIERDLNALTRPFNCCLLGMGDDGHFASLFPDFAGLRKALDPGSDESCVLVETSGSDHLRVSLTLSALLDSELVLLLFFGQSKLDVFNSASASAGNYPVEALLKQQRTPVRALWAP
jgi:6-phosphogluconolactonase